MYHSEKRREQLEHQLDTLKNKVKQDESLLKREEATLKSVSSEYSKNSLKLQKSTRIIRKKEKQLVEKQNSIVPINEKLSIFTSKQRQMEKKKEDINKDIDRQKQYLSDYQQQLQIVERSANKYEQELVTPGVELSADSLGEYERLKAQFNQLASTERSEMTTFLKQQKSALDKVNSLKSKLEQSRSRIADLELSISELKQQKDDITHKHNQTLQLIDEKKESLSNIRSDKQQIATKENDLNEKLKECLNSLLDLNANQRESERDRKLRENVVSMRRLIPGVRGLVHDLCKPKQKKYELAVSTVLGKNFDAIVVNSAATAQKCISYLKEQRAGTASFIPLDTITVTPLNNSLRNIDPGTRPVLDVVDYDPANERAIHYACGSAIVCDNLDIAKYVRWERKISVKAVALDGSLIHKAGLMTGGQGKNSNKRWEQSSVQGLRKLKEKLIGDLKDLQSKKVSDNEENQLLEELSILEDKLPYLREDLQTIEQSINDRQRELQYHTNQVRVVSTSLTQEESSYTSVTKQFEKSKRSVDVIEDRVFGDFCNRVGLANIREYESSHGSVLREIAQERLKFSKQRSKLESQINFEKERLNDTTSRAENLQKLIDLDHIQLEQLRAEKDGLNEAIDTLESEIEVLTGELDEEKQKLVSKQQNIASIQDSVNAYHKKREMAQRDASAIEEDIEKEIADKFNTLRNCKIDNIEIPMSKGSLDALPVGGAAIRTIDEEDSHGSDHPVGLRSSQSSNLKINYSSLSTILKNDTSEDRDHDMLEEINLLTSQMEEMTPNMKASDRLVEAENRIKGHEKEFMKLKKKEQNVQARFKEVREQRLEKFMSAYDHISSQIDQVYKDLTKNKANIYGGSADLTLEDEDEPYLKGVKFHAMPPMKRFRDMELLSGGEKTMAALALLFSIHSYRPSPFFVLDEVDAALDYANVSEIANYIKEHSGPGFQFIVISLKNGLFEKSEALVGIYREQTENSSRVLTIDLRNYQED